MTPDQEYNRNRFVTDAVMCYLRREFDWETRDQGLDARTSDKFVEFLKKTADKLGITTEIAMKPDDKPSSPQFSYPLVLEQHIIWCIINKK